MSNLSKPELLAPAGNMECLQAAVSAGADAVYLGVDKFNARRGADNFTLESLAEACDYAHMRGTKIYLTVNTAILAHETDEFMELIRQAYRAGVDAFIVQDIGVAQEMRRTLPQAELHISTQMNTHNRAGIMAAHALGAHRVTLARELSLAEIKNLSDFAHELGMEIETFTHGALCVCYSGQCFMSALIGGRSANRGTCAQACRLPYTLHNKAQRSAVSAEGDRLLSPKDLCTIDMLDDMITSGTDSLKIEGRMKSADYVYSVVSIYRAVLDRVFDALVEGRDAKGLVTEEEQRALSGVFSRGFTTAYLTQERDNSIMSYGRSNNRGMFIGRVAYANGKKVSLSCQDALNVGDILEFWTGKGHFSHTVTACDKNKQGEYVLVLQDYASKGDRVFRVRNASQAFDLATSEKKVEVTGCVYARLGAPLEVSFTSPDGLVARAFGDEVQAARTKALEQDDVISHINRTGGTPFVITDLYVELDEGVGMGFSQLHKLRKSALEELERLMLASYKNRKLERIEEVHDAPSRPKHKNRVAVMATNPACARAAKRAGADVIYVPVLNYKRGEAIVAGQLSSTVEQAGYPKQAVMALPVIEHDCDGGSREEQVNFDAWSPILPDKPVYVENFGQMVRARELNASIELGTHVPVLNSLALRTARDFGAEMVWLSPELSLTQIKEMGASRILPLGITIIGHTEMMITEHCVLMSEGPCNQRCSSCARRKSPHYLKDRKGYEMPVVSDICGRTHIYNAVSLDIAHLVPELMQAGVSDFMVDTTMMNVTETTEAVKRAVRARDIAVSGGNAVAKTQGATTGLIYRGIQ